MLLKLRSTVVSILSLLSCLTGLSTAQAQTDANGSLRAHGEWTYAYDIANRLRTSVAADGREVHYEYDGLGQQVAQTRCAPDGTCTRTELLLDESGSLPVVVGIVDDGAGRTYYAWGPEGLAAQAGAGEPPQYPLLDHQRSVRAFVQAGAVTQHLVFDAWGRPLHDSDPGRSPAGLFGYNGEWHNPDGTIHLRARTYHPALHRFLQRDRFEGSAARPAWLHRYAYAENDPLAFSDPTGFSAERARCSDELREVQQRIDTTSLAMGLTGVGDIPAAVLDLTSAGMSARCGDYWGAVLSVGGTFPIIGLTANAAKVGGQADGLRPLSEAADRFRRNNGIPPPRPEDADFFEPHDCGHELCGFANEVTYIGQGPDIWDAYRNNPGLQDNLGFQPGQTPPEYQGLYAPVDTPEIFARIRAQVQTTADLNSISTTDLLSRINRSGSDPHALDGLYYIPFGDTVAGR